MPGDVIACGTSVGVGVMHDAENTIEISIDGIGTLSNRFTQLLPSEYLLGSAPKPARICVVGAGAIGGLMAAKLALAGNEVTVIDVGAQLTHSAKRAEACLARRQGVYGEGSRCWVGPNRQGRRTSLSSR